MTLYTTHCPKCKVLEQKLKQKKVNYKTCEDISKMEKMGIDFVPVLEVNGDLLDFSKAVKYVNNLEEE